MRTIKRLISLIFGLAVISLGTYLTIQANIGLAPWDAFHTGVATLTGRRYGDIAVTFSVIIIIIDFLLGEKIGVGTLLNGILVGKFVDLYQWCGFVKPMENFWAGVLLMTLGQVFLSFGIYLYMRTGWGCGPRDALMVAVNKRLPKMPVGLARATIDGSALLGGWLLGAKIGLGTVLFVLCMSSVLQAVMRLMHFDPKKIQHEGLADTFAKLKAKSSA